MFDERRVFVIARTGTVLLTIRCHVMMLHVGRRGTATKLVHCGRFWIVGGSGLLHWTR